MYYVTFSQNHFLIYDRNSICRLTRACTGVVIVRLIIKYFICRSIANKGLDKTRLTRKCFHIETKWTVVAQISLFGCRPYCIEIRSRIDNSKLIRRRVNGYKMNVDLESDTRKGVFCSTSTQILFDKSHFLLKLGLFISNCNFVAQSKSSPLIFVLFLDGVGI